MNKKAVSLRRGFLIHMISLTLISVGLWGLIWIHDEYAAFTEETEALRKTYTESQKQMIRDQTTGVVNYIRYKMDQTETRLKASIRARVQEAHDIATNLHIRYRDRKSPGEIQLMIKDALRPIRFNNGRGYYFAFNLEGVEELFADRPEMEGRNMLDVTGGRGEYVVRDMIELARMRGEGFYEYTWTKPGAAGKEHLKIAYVKRFDPYDWVIGTGEYVEDVASEIQQEVIDRVAGLRYEPDGYFFGSAEGGAPLFSNGRITRGGSSIWDLTDPNGIKIIQEQQTAARNPEGGFVPYSWPKLDAKAPIPKISYVQGIPEWGWVIGTGVYLDRVEADIAAKKEALSDRMRAKIRKSAVILLSLVVLILIWTRHISRKIQVGIDTFSVFLGGNPAEPVHINPETLRFSEFQDIARFINRMMAERKQTEEERRRLERRVQQAEKRESLRVMAAGIAHNFNNLLTVVLGNIEMAIEDLPKAFPSAVQIRQAEKAARQAADLSLLMLTYLGHGVRKKQRMDLGAALEGFSPLIREQAPKNVRLEFDVSEKGLFAALDPDDVRRVVMNLAVNACEAAEKTGGVVRVSAGKLEDAGMLTETNHACDPLEGGPWVWLDVSDTGPGMDKETQHRIFDPFYTTKFTGRGLGLPAVLGIVRACDGGIYVTSAPGEGTSIRVMFPCADGLAAKNASVHPPSGE